MKRVLKHIYESIKLLIGIMVANIMLLNKKNRQIYLIGERRNEAKDNGYHLFKYVREIHPKDRFYYIIDKSSNDLSRIENFGNIIYYNSLKHYIYYIMSRKLICAHIGSCTPDSAICWSLEDKKIIKKYRMFIQHGIIKELIPSLMCENTDISEFICGAKPEYDFVIEQFGYKKDNVKYLGLCRFDNLHDYKVKNQVLIMPTWRKWIPSTTWADENKDDNIKVFLETEYYKKYNELINNNEFIKYLKENNMKAFFYLHYEMQVYRDLFTKKSNSVIIADIKNYDVQELLKESKLLITDYSSIAFDFAYMRKPIIYYQFDKERYDKQHYQKGYFDYENDGFGPTASNLNELIIYMYDIDNKSEERASKFFELYDRKNCERHYEEIIKI